MESLTPVPPPWTLKGDFYTFVCQIPPPLASGFPQQAFSPLEASSEFSRSSVSRPVGGLGVVMIIRYHESPVGPYDELALIPGKFEWLEKPLNGPPLESRDYKISRIYVSQKQTCYNGRVSKYSNFVSQVLPERDLYGCDSNCNNNCKVICRTVGCVVANVWTGRLEYSKAFGSL